MAAVVLLLGFCAMPPIAGRANAFEVLNTAPLEVSDIQTIISAAVTRAVRDKVLVVVAVSDREGTPLAVYDMTGVPAGSDDVDVINKNATLLCFGTPCNPTLAERTALEKARTAAFLSSDQDAFSTLTAKTLVAEHFPLGITNAAQAPLFGLQFSQLPCAVDALTEPLGASNGNGTTGALGGIPLYKKHEIAGGIGVDGDGNGASQSEDEKIALAGDSKYSPSTAITANQIYLGGFQLPWTTQPPPKPLPLIPFASLPGNPSPNFPNITPTPMTSFPAAVFAGVPGEIRIPIIDSPIPGTLTAADVTTLITQSIEMAKATRAAIRQPIGVPARMQVGVTDLDGNILGEFRTNDATMFSFDIVIQKGRTVTAFSDPNQPLGQQLRQMLGLAADRELAVSPRTIGFLAQPFYPPGINGTSPGPLFMIQQDLLLSQPIQPPLPPCAPAIGDNGDGITAFPGATPLYKSGMLVGGLGISGDGVDQDDYVTNAGAAGYLPDPSIRADQIQFRGTTLPFFKFPRHPGL